MVRFNVPIQSQGHSYSFWLTLFLGLTTGKKRKGEDIIEGESPVKKPRIDDPSPNGGTMWQ